MIPIMTFMKLPSLSVAKRPGEKVLRNGPFSCLFDDLRS